MKTIKTIILANKQLVKFIYLAHIKIYSINQDVFSGKYRKQITPPPPIPPV